MILSKHNVTTVFLLTKGGICMYLLSVLALIVLSIGYILLSSGGKVYYFLDLPSLIILILITIPILMSAGLLKDFNNAFRLGIIRNANPSRTELQRALEAVSLAMKALWVSGIFDSILQLIIVFAEYASETAPRILNAYFSIILIPLMYAAFFVILLLPLKSRLSLRLSELSDCSPQSDTQSN